MAASQSLIEKPLIAASGGYGNMMSSQLKHG